MENLKVKFVAFTDAAGKVNEAAPRRGNEDNMFVKVRFAGDNSDCSFVPGQEMELGKLGCVMAVADGMGGMNAGEVASEIAINTVREAFSDIQEVSRHSSTARLRESFLSNVIVGADKAVKLYSSQNPECQGMGSTIIVAWIYGTELTISWCGDSRAYLYRESEGLRQISKDHSYVQSLVDEGKITEDEAFSHPYNNIVTRSLGDTSCKARPDARTLPVYRDDIIMLNSDGLNGVLKDDVMESIIRDSGDNIVLCREKLWYAAESLGWYDNVTVVLARITGGLQYDCRQLSAADTGYYIFRVKKSIFFMMAASIFLIVAAVIAYSLLNVRSDEDIDCSEDTVIVNPDSTMTVESVQNTGNGSVDQIDIPGQHKEIGTDSELKLQKASAEQQIVKDTIPQESIKMN